jgi:hypothetical protein
MTKRNLTMNEYWNLFLRGRLYLIRRVEKDWVTLSRLRRYKNGLKVSEFRFTRQLGFPEKGGVAQESDMAFKGYGMRWRLLKMIVKK